MIQALCVVLLAGFVARSFLSGRKPGAAVTVMAGLGGCLLGFLIGHGVLGQHEFHLFALESLLPATAGSFALLVIAKRAMRVSDRDYRFR